MINIYSKKKTDIEKTINDMMNKDVIDKSNSKVLQHTIQYEEKSKRKILPKDIFDNMKNKNKTNNNVKKRSK